MKKIIFLAILILTIAFVHAESDCHEIAEGIDELKDFEVPNGIPYKNERINAYTIDGDVIGHLILENKIVTSVGCDNITEPTYNVYIKGKSTIEDIENANNFIAEFNSKVKEGEIRIEGVTTTKKVKGFFTRLGLKIASWFT